MKAIETLIAIIFVLVAALFLMYGLSIRVTSSIHQIQQMLSFICAILCFGFGCLMVKSTGSK